MMRIISMLSMFASMCDKMFPLHSQDQIEFVRWNQRTVADSRKLFKHFRIVGLDNFGPIWSANENHLIFHKKIRRKKNKPIDKPLLLVNIYHLSSHMAWKIRLVTVYRFGKKMKEMKMKNKIKFMIINSKMILSISLWPNCSIENDPFLQYCQTHFTLYFDKFEIGNHNVCR